MLNSLVLPLEKLFKEPYASVMCYPKTENIELQKRLLELQKLGVKAVEFCGKKEVFNTPILGKGHVGIVIVAYLNRLKIALKIRRVDADRSGLQHEAKMLYNANSVHVGPKILGFSKDFLLMQFINGDLFPDWLEKHNEKAQLKRLLNDVLEQCWRLDGIRLDHGELVHAPKHIILSGEDKPFIVDYETASVSRKPANVTSLCHFLFIGSAVAKRINERLGKRDLKVLIDALRHYKSNRTRENFEKILNVYQLQHI